jgi:adenosylcobinamide-phosphate synthase
MSFFQVSTIIQDAYIPIGVVCLALLLEKLMPISSSIDPLAFFRFICQQMSKKVCKQSYSKQQLFISGCLATILLVLPILIIVYLLHEFASYQWLLDTLLLWILLQFTQDSYLCRKAMDALSADKKQLSKNILQNKLLRNTRPLSSLGLIKASGESVFLRYHHQQFTTIVCYLLIGPIAALGYRLCYEAHQAWNIKSILFAHFGQLANIITLIFQLLPSIIMSISFVFIADPKASAKVVTSKTFWKILSKALLKQDIHSLLLYSLAIGLRVNTGGPVIYDGIKYQRPRFEPHIPAEANFKTLNTLISLINRHLIVSLLGITWIVFWLSFT